MDEVGEEIRTEVEAIIDQLNQLELSNSTAEIPGNIDESVEKYDDIFYNVIMAPALIVGISLCFYFFGFVVFCGNIMSFLIG